MQLRASQNPWMALQWLLPLLLLLLTSGRCQVCTDPRPLPSFDDTFEFLNTSIWAVTEGLNHCNVAASCTYQTIRNAQFNATLDPTAALPRPPPIVADQRPRTILATTPAPTPETVAKRVLAALQAYGMRTTPSLLAPDAAPVAAGTGASAHLRGLPEPLASSMDTREAPQQRRLLAQPLDTPPSSPSSSPPSYGPSYGPKGGPPSYPSSYPTSPQPQPSEPSPVPSPQPSPLLSPTSPPRGLWMQLSRDPCVTTPSSCCGPNKAGRTLCTRWSGYHMATPLCMRYGSLEVTMALYMPPGSYSVLYVGLYSGVGPNNVNPWQEIDIGWTGFTVVNGSVVNNATLITDTYVNGPLIQGPAVSLGSWSDMLSFRAYRLDWSEDLLTWSVDGQVVHSLQGKGNVPDLPQSLRVIFRTAHGAGDGPASQVWIQRMKYTAAA